MKIKRILEAIIPIEEDYDYLPYHNSKKSMKMKRYIITATILSLAILSYLFRDALVTPESIPSKVKVNSEQKINEELVDEKIPQENEEEALSKNEEEKELGDKEKKMFRMLHEDFTKADAPITFYGKVLDQDKKPVAGVKISGHATYYKGFVKLDDLSTNGGGSGPYREKAFSVKTDNKGNFTLDRLKGRSIKFDLKMENYTTSNKSYHYTYDPSEINLVHKPDLNNPIILTMWKKLNQERVDRSQLSVGLEKNQESYIEMLPVPREANAKNNDFSIKIVSENIGKPEEKWTLFLESKDGGFVISEDEFMYQAPEKGYKNKLELIISDDKKFPQNDYKLKLYHKAADGTYYSSLTCNIMKFKDGGGSFSFESLVNPNNSRNLQP